MEMVGEMEEGYGPEGAMYHQQQQYQDFQDDEDEEDEEEDCGDEDGFDMEEIYENQQDQRRSMSSSMNSSNSNLSMSMLKGGSNQNQNHYSNSSGGGRSRGSNNNNNNSSSYYSNGTNSSGYRYSNSNSTVMSHNQGGNSHHNSAGGSGGSGSAEVDYDEEYSEEEPEYDNNYGYHPHRGSQHLIQARSQDDDEDDYPDMLQFCEAQMDDNDDDEEARGLPPPTKGCYEGEDLSTDGQGTSRVTTNASGIRIVESSTILEPEEDDDEDFYDQNYEQYEDLGEMETPVQMTIPFPAQPKKIAMNKPRKYRPEKAAADALLRQIQSGEFDYSKQNILARKLMGVPSHTVQTNRPPPLMKKPHQSRQQQQLQPKPAPAPVSLESILRQQPRPSMPRLQARSATSSLLSQNQLKIKTSHGIPPHKMAFPNNLQQKQRAPKFQQNSQPTTSSRFQQQGSSTLQSSISLIRSKAKSSQQVQQNYQYQQSNSSQPRIRNNANNGSNNNNNRQLMSSIEQQMLQQQSNGMPLSSKPLKNVPRCHVCKRTFATNQVLQRHMALHGPIATITETESGEYKCEECMEEFENQFLLAKHMQSHANTASSTSNSSVHRCRVCYRTFTCIDSLKAHSLLHEGDFKCRACRRGFADWSTLEEHEATHKRYNCNWCDKYFMNSGNLKAHERIHTGERPYKCKDCPKAFKQLGGLQYHLKTNPNHKPVKYHKMDGVGPEGDREDDDGGMSYPGPLSMAYEDSGEDYEDATNLMTASSY